jgi:hypothetical protein
VELLNLTVETLLNQQIEIISFFRSMEALMVPRTTC